MMSEFGQNLRVFWFFAWHDHAVAGSAQVPQWGSTASLGGLGCSWAVQALLSLSSSHRALQGSSMCTKGPLALSKLCFQCTVHTICLLGKFCCLLPSYSSVVSMEGNGQNIAPGLKGLVCALVGDTDIYLLQSPLKFGNKTLQILSSCYHVVTIIQWGDEVPYTEFTNIEQIPVQFKKILFYLLQKFSTVSPAV